MRIQAHRSGKSFELIIGSESAEAAYILGFDQGTGIPTYQGIPGIDMFPSFDDAVGSRVQEGVHCQEIEVQANLGVVKYKRNAALILVTEAVVIGNLLNQGSIMKVEKVEYIWFPSEPEENPFKHLDLESNFIYSPTLNLTRPFPNNDNLLDPDFCWNQEWIRPFKRIGFGSCCIHLIQGTYSVLSHVLELGDTSISLLVKRSCANTGGHIDGRGINEDGAPANEAESELFIWDNNDYRVYRWRRGSIPLRWKSTVNPLIFGLSHSVKEDYMHGTAEYFNGLRDRLGVDRIYCVSLLAEKSKSGENVLESKYVEAVDLLDLDFVVVKQFDFNKVLHTNGSHATYEIFQQTFGEDLLGLGYSSPTTVQNGIIRVNCASSMDRTNFFCFFYAVLVTTSLFNGTIPTPVMDFLVDSFSNAGNHISRCYCNTNTLNSSYLTEFSSTKKSQQKDFKILLKRATGGLFGATGRTAVLTTLVHPPLLGGYATSLDSRTNKFQIDNSIYLVLPEWIVPKALRIFRSTNRPTPIKVQNMSDADYNKPIILPGVSTSGVLEYALEIDYAVRVIVVTMEDVDGTLCPNVIQVCGEIGDSLLMAPSIDQIREYKSEMDNLPPTPRFQDSLNLETMRVNYGISSVTRTNYALLRSIDPVMLDTSLISNKNKKCPCGNRLSKECQFQKSGTLILPYANGEPFYVCRECAPRMTAYSERAACIVPLRRSCQFKPYLEIPEIPYRFISDVHFVSSVPDLFEDEIETHLSGTTDIQVFFVRSVRLSRISINSDNAVDISSDDIAESVLEDGCFNITTANESVNVIRFTLTTQTPTVVRRIDMFGEFPNQVIVLPPVDLSYTPGIYETVARVKIDSATTKKTFNFRRNISALSVRPRSRTCAPFLATFHHRSGDTTLNVVVPSSKSDVRLYFDLDHPIEAETVTIQYYNAGCRTTIRFHSILNNSMGS